jgi:hypothetical protein
MSVEPMIIVGLAILVAVWIYNVTVSPRAKTRRRLVRTPRTLTTRLHAGMARVTGRAMHGKELLRSPASDRPCVAFDFGVEVNDGSSGWCEVLRLRDVTPFLVRDEGGQARVEPGSHYELLLAESNRGTDLYSRSPDPQELARVVALLPSNQRPSGHWLTSSSIRFFEAVLLEGDLVSILALVSEEVHPEEEPAGPRSLPVARVLRGTSERLMYIGGPDVAFDGLPPLSPLSAS